MMLGAKVVYGKGDIHVSGSFQEDQKLMLALTAQVLRARAR